MKSYFADYLAEWEKDPDSRPRSRRAASIKRRAERAEEATFLVESGDNSEGGFRPTFSSSKHEREWILTYLGPFYDDNLISDVLRQVKGGKEATVYCCAGHPSTGIPLIAAKVYRPRMFRNLRNDAVYRQGRVVVNEKGQAVRSREARAMERGTAFGQGLRHTSWLTSEYEMLGRLHAAGADVPRPLAFNDNAILMEYMGDQLAPAPTLNGVRLPPEEAAALFARVLENVELLLANECVHGDLSAHNILYWEGAVTLIDFPQAVNPFANPAAEDLFRRDVERVCQYFARYGITAGSADIATAMWRKHVLAEDFELRAGS